MFRVWSSQPFSQHTTYFQSKTRVIQGFLWNYPYSLTLLITALVAENSLTLVTSLWSHSPYWPININGVTAVAEERLVGGCHVHFPCNFLLNKGNTECAELLIDTDEKRLWKQFHWRHEGCFTLGMFRYQYQKHVWYCFKCRCLYRWVQESVTRSDTVWLSFIFCFVKPCHCNTVNKGPLQLCDR